MKAIDLIKAVPRGSRALVFILDDPEAQRVMVAWEVCGSRKVDCAFTKADAVETIIERLWQRAEPIDFEDMSHVADVPKTRCEKVFSRLKRAHLIYPDGTANKLATELLDNANIARVRWIAAGKRK